MGEMKCSFDECENKAEGGIGWGTNKKGSIPVCKECQRTFLEHDKARKEAFFDEMEALIKKARGTA